MTGIGKHGDKRVRIVVSYNLYDNRVCAVHIPSSRFGEDYGNKL